MTRSKYEVFISFKKSAKDGSITEDYEIANELYSRLSEKRINVFFSERELSDTNFNDQIYHALDEAWILIVVGTRSEYVNSKWVKSEWENFYCDINSGKKESGQILTVLKGMTPSELPIQLRNLQSFNIRDFDKAIGFVLRLVKLSNSTTESDNAPESEYCCNNVDLSQKTRKRVIYNILSLDDNYDVLEMLEKSLNLEVEKDHFCPYEIRTINASNIIQAISLSKDFTIDVYIFDVVKKAPSNDKDAPFGIQLIEMLLEDKPNILTKSQFFIYSKLPSEMTRKEFDKSKIEFYTKQSVSQQQMAKIDFYSKLTISPQQMAKIVKQYLDQLFFDELHPTNRPI